jgi:Xaa-Pro aminopeptidase
MMNREFSSKEISRIHTQLMALLERHNLAGLWITSTDAHLSEYTPIIENYRYWITGFTGSVAYSYVDRQGIHLFVDGRYHEQADLECVPLGIQVIKVPYGVSLEDALFEFMPKGGSKIGVMSKKTSLEWTERWAQSFTWVSLTMDNDPELVGIFPATDHPADGLVRELPLSICGEGRLEKWARLFAADEVFFTPTLDTLSWLLNARAHHRPYQSTVKGIGFFTRHKALIFVPPETQLDPAWTKASDVQWCLIHEGQDEQMRSLIAQFLNPEIKILRTFKSALTLWHSELLGQLDLRIALLEGSSSLWHADKNPAELKAHHEAFMKASQAISRSLSQIAQELNGGKSLSEWDVRERLENEYKNQGMMELSFRTIAGVGSNGSIIHYGGSSKQKVIGPSELILVDSGAYDEAGLATDTTRTFLSFGKALPWQKEIYTLVLKSLIQLSKVQFKIGTPGGVIDELARRPLKERGYDYAHGTGHGVGILVHEGGYRLAIKNETPLLPGRVGSLEPGIYLPGKGGVRLENVAEVRLVEGTTDLLEFVPMTWVGFDHRLIDRELLDQAELEWLSAYEEKCQRLGTDFKS